jgi:hypothetical protein
MATLFDAAYKALAGRTRRLETSAASAQVAHLERQYGSMAEASRRTGIPRTTLRRWKSGDARPKPTDRRLTRAVRETLVPEGRRRRVKRSTGNPKFDRTETRTAGRGSGAVRSGHGGLTVTASVTVSSDTRDRTMFVGQHLTADRGDALLAAFLDGDNAKMEEILNGAFAAYFGSPSSWTLNDVHSVGFEPIR